MLINIPLQDLPRPDVTVVTDSDMTHTITLLARVLRARNPLITAPPPGNVAWSSVGTDLTKDPIVDLLNAAVIDPTFLRLPKTPDAEGPLAENPALRPWLIAATNVGLSGLLSFPRVYANSVPAVQEALKILCSEGTTNSGRYPEKGDELSELIKRDPMRIPFCQIALSMAYETIVRSGLFTKLTPAENSSERGQMAVFERALLLRTLLRVLSIQTVMPRLRPILRYLRMEQPKARLREELVPANVEYWEQIIDRILAMPVHPWMARVEETSLPTSRATPWGRSTPTIILDRTYLRSPWGGRGTPTEGERAAYATEMTTRLDAPVVLDGLQPILKDFRRFMDDIETDGHFARIAAVLNFTTPRTPTPIPLWGDAFQPIHMDGLNATTSIQDLVATSYQIHLPVLGAVHSPWVGDDERINYFGAERADGTNTMWSEFAATFAVAPEDIVADDNFFASRFTPKMFQMKSTHYKGDMSAMMFPATIEGVASILGKKVPEMTALIKADIGQWAHIFSVNGNEEVKPNDPEGTLFYSDRTAMTWLTDITLPRRGVPTVMWALRRGKPETALPTRARFVRDAMIPVATVPLAGAVAKLEKDAIPVALGGVK